MNDTTDRLGGEHRDLASLLGEYAGKLRTDCDAYYDRKTRWAGRAFSFTLMVGVGFLLTALCFEPGIIFQFASRNWEPTQLNYFEGDLRLLVVPMIMATGLIAVAGAVVMFRSRSELYRSRFAFRPIVAALEGLVDRASYLEGRTQLDSDGRLIFALRLAEAESALEYADWVIGSNPFWPRFHRNDSGGEPSRQYRTRRMAL